LRSDMSVWRNVGWAERLMLFIPLYRTDTAHTVSHSLKPPLKPPPTSQSVVRYGGAPPLLGPLYISPPPRCPHVKEVTNGLIARPLD
jgi:hypothetical protein